MSSVTYIHHATPAHAHHSTSTNRSLSLSLFPLLFRAHSLDTRPATLTTLAHSTSPLPNTCDPPSSPPSLLYSLFRSFSLSLLSVSLSSLTRPCAPPHTWMRPSMPTLGCLHLPHLYCWIRAGSLGLAPIVSAVFCRLDPGEVEPACWTAPLCAAPAGNEDIVCVCVCVCVCGGSLWKDIWKTGQGRRVCVREKETDPTHRHTLARQAASVARGGFGVGSCTRARCTIQATRGRAT